MTKEELIRDEDYSEEEAMRMVLHNKIDNLKEENEDLKDIIKTIKEKVKSDREINKQCSEKTTGHNFTNVIKLWDKFDKEILEIMEEE